MFYIPRQLARGLNETVKRIMYDFFFPLALSISALWLKALTRQSNHCGFSIYIFDNSKSKSMVRLVRAEKMVLSGLVFARKIARMILIQNIQGLMGPLMFNMAFMPLYMWEMWDVTPVTNARTHGRTVESSAVFSLRWIRKIKSPWLLCTSSCEHHVPHSTLRPWLFQPRLISQSSEAQEMASQCSRSPRSKWPRCNALIDSKREFATAFLCLPLFHL